MKPVSVELSAKLVEAAESFHLLLQLLEGLTAPEEPTDMVSVFQYPRVQHRKYYFTVSGYRVGPQKTPEKKQKTKSFLII